MVEPGYKIINDLNFEPGEVVVEIGSERGEGSTAYFADFCRARQINFYTVDVEKAQYENVVRLSDEYVSAYCVTGEDFLAEVFPNFEKLAKFVYLDNFDWIYEGTDHRGHVRRAVEIYKARGVDLNNAGSQNAHLKQTKLISSFMAKNGVILFDDTWQRSEGKFSGKGGTAVPWLRAKGYEIYKMYNTPDLEWNFVSVIKTT